MTDYEKLAMVGYIIQGMLAHPRRYKPRDQDSDKHWHDAMAAEAFDLAEAVSREATARGIDNQVG